jgi:transposase
MMPTAVRIFVCTAPVDMRFGFDRLAQVARERVGQEPQQGGALFVFANKRASRLKILWFERNGLCLLYKRLHQAVFELPLAAGGLASVHVDASALAKLLEGVPKEEHRAKKTGARSRAA